MSMSKHASTIAKSATLLATIAALIAASTPFANAADAVAATSPLDAPAAPYQIIAIQRRQASAPARTDMTFHPNYDNALSVGQMSAAWQAELDRLFPQPVTGGG